MSILQQGIVPTSAGGYEIANSLRFNDNDSAYLSRTPSSAGNQQTWTWSAWVKRGNLGTEQSVSICVQWSNIFNIYFRSDDKLSWDVEYSSARIIAYTDRVFRDTSAWYHIVATLDTTNSTASERLKIWVNGELQTFPNYAYGSGYIAQNSSLIINSTTRSHNIGRRGDNPVGQYLDGYLAEVNFIDGQALDPSNFGETGDYGEWKPIEYTGTYGTNGFYLDFENSGSLGADVSGNSNNWTPYNLAATDQMLDSPTNNFCTLNPIWIGGGSLSQGNLRTSGGVNNGVGTMAVSSGKWYWEYFVEDSGSINHTGIKSTYYSSIGDLTDMLLIKENGNYILNDGAETSGPDSFTTGDIIGTAIDVDAETISFYKNGTIMSGMTNFDYSSMNGTSGGIYPAVRDNNGSESVLNFGQDLSFAGNKTAQGNTDGNGYGDFYYTPPTGYLALCTQNLPDPTVIPSEHFNTVLYSGDSNGNAQSITGVGFQPDFTWIKSRSVARSHRLLDAVRGATKELYSDASDSESIVSNGLTSFDSDGFSVGTSVGVNDVSQSFVAWNWKANGTGSSNTNGTITSTVSANQDAGFSIVNYTGNKSGAVESVGHGLSKTPELIIQKARQTATQGVNGWLIGGTVLGSAGSYINGLHNTATKSNASTYWANTLPDATKFYVGTGSWVGNDLNIGYINYCFHSVDGYSKVGSYTGNGSTDGTFVYTSFAPKFVMIKNTDTSSWSWDMFDNERDPYNPTDTYLAANSSDAENSNAVYAKDFTSNGFKLRTTHQTENGNGNNYIYIAFADVPFKYSTGV